MMSAQCDWRGRLPALAYPAISAEAAAPCMAARRPAPLCSSGWMSRPDGVLGCHPSMGTTFWFARVVALPSKSRSQPAGSLCGSP